MSKFQFRKGFNAQHCFLATVEKWHKTLDGGSETGAILTDLSKTFDCIDHNLLIAKLSAYGFEKQSINFMYSYRTKHKQRTKVDSLSSWEMLFSGLLQGFLLGPLLLNIYIYISVTSLKNVVDNLQGALKKMFRWFSTNNLVVNALLASSKTPYIFLILRS